jgi:hypothetical protein
MDIKDSEDAGEIPKDADSRPTSSADGLARILAEDHAGSPSEQAQVTMCG